jgi:hypothetical protein
VPKDATNPEKFQESIISPIIISHQSLLDLVVTTVKFGRKNYSSISPTTIERELK